jgi:hypothetical protein
MDNIFKDIRNTTFDYSKKITINKFTQDINKIVKDETVYYKSIFELILSFKDINYSVLNPDEIESYVKTQLLDLCNIIDTNYTDYNLNKKVLSKQTLCKNIQLNKDILSSILFYNEYFKINLIIFNKDSNKFYKTGLKDSDKIYISYYDKKWFIHDNVDDSGNYSDIYELSSIIDIDMKHNFIYNTYLKAISNYKSDDLIKVANELNISLTNDNGKKKIKKELYDEINLIKL